MCRKQVIVFFNDDFLLILVETVFASIYIIRQKPNLFSCVVIFWLFLSYNALKHNTRF